MKSLIHELKGEHEALKSLLMMLQEEKMDHEDQVVMVKTTKAKLLAHLAKEDKQLYPLLRITAEKDPALEKKLEMFDDNMKYVTTKVLEFYQSYENGWGNKERFKFRMDLAEVISLLTGRIQIEEEQLYPEYELRLENPNYKSKSGFLTRLGRLFGV